MLAAAPARGAATITAVTELADASLPEALRAPPKAELHCHVEGTMRPQTVAELAGKNGTGLRRRRHRRPGHRPRRDDRRLVLASLMAARRLRISPRVAKRAMSRYNARGKVDRTTYKATIDIAILTTALTPGDEP